MTGDWAEFVAAEGPEIAAIRARSRPPIYPLYRVGRQYFNRLSRARIVAKREGRVVEMWLTPEERTEKGVCFQIVTN